MMVNNQCIGVHGIAKNSTVRILSTSETREDDTQTVHVCTPDGENITISAAKYDSWFIVALKIHGVTKIPINNIKLHGNDRRINLR